MRLVPIYLWVYLKRTLAAFRRIPEKMVGRLSALKHNRTIKYSAADFDYKDCNFLLNLLFPWNDLFFASSSFRYYWTNRKRIINAFPRRNFFLWKELLVALHKMAKTSLALVVILLVAFVHAQNLEDRLRSFRSRLRVRPEDRNSQASSSDDADDTRDQRQLANNLRTRSRVRRPPIVRPGDLAKEDESFTLSSSRNPAR